MLRPFPGHLVKHLGARLFDNSHTFWGRHLAKRTRRCWKSWRDPCLGSPITANSTASPHSPGNQRTPHSWLIHAGSGGFRHHPVDNAPGDFKKPRVCRLGICSNAVTAEGKGELPQIFQMLPPTTTTTAKGISGQATARDRLFFPTGQ